MIGIKPENIYDMDSFNYMSHIHDNEVNNIAEFNLLHGIPNHYKHTKI